MSRVHSILKLLARAVAPGQGLLAACDSYVAVGTVRLLPGSMDGAELDAGCSSGIGNLGIRLLQQHSYPQQPEIPATATGHAVAPRSLLSSASFSAGIVRDWRFGPLLGSQWVGSVWLSPIAGRGEATAASSARGGDRQPGNLRALARGGRQLSASDDIAAVQLTLPANYAEFCNLYPDSCRTIEAVKVCPRGFYALCDDFLFHRVRFQLRSLMQAGVEVQRCWYWPWPHMRSRSNLILIPHAQVAHYTKGAGSFDSVLAMTPTMDTSRYQLLSGVVDISISSRTSGTICDVGYPCAMGLSIPTDSYDSNGGNVSCVLLEEQSDAGGLLVPRMWELRPASIGTDNNKVRRSAESLWLHN